MGRWQASYDFKMKCAAAARAAAGWQEISVEEYAELYLSHPLTIDASGTLKHAGGWVIGYFTEWKSKDGVRLRYESRAEGSTYFKCEVK